MCCILNPYESPVNCCIDSEKSLKNLNYVLYEAFYNQAHKFKF